MARFTGSALYVDWIWSGGTVALSGAGMQKSFDDSHSIDKADASAGSDAYRNFLPTIKDRTFTMESLHRGTENPGGTATQQALEPGTWGTLRWGALGTAAGLPKGGAYCFVTKNDTSLPFDDVVMVSREWQNSGDLVYNPNSAVWP